MSSIDTRAFPEITQLAWGREREINQIKSKHAVDPGSEQIALFWQELGQRISKDDDLNNVARAGSEVRSDIDLLHAMRDRLQGRRDPESQIQIQLITRLLMFLLEAQGAIMRRLRMLRERAYQYHLLYNPAMGSKIDEKMKAEKDKEKDGGQASDADVRRALDDAKKPAGPAVKDEKAVDKREKKIAP